MSHFEKVHLETVDGFQLVFSVAREYGKPDWEFEDDADEQETMRQIETGELVHFTARMEASKGGIVLGTDYLGGCCYHSVQQFIDSNDYYADMKAMAIDEARRTLKELCECTEGV